jgi:hypothetical protein
MGPWSARHHDSPTGSSPAGRTGAEGRNAAAGDQGGPDGGPLELDRSEAEALAEVLRPVLDHDRHVTTGAVHPDCPQCTAIEACRRIVDYVDSAAPTRSGGRH